MNGRRKLARSKATIIHGAHSEGIRLLESDHIISVQPHFLTHDKAVIAAEAVQKILSWFSPKLMGLIPELKMQDISNLLKLFMLALGLLIAPFKLLFCESTSGLFMCLSNEENDDCVGLLTWDSFSRGHYSPWAGIITDSSKTAVDDIMTFIGNQATYIEAWTASLKKIPELMPNEAKRNKLLNLIETAMTKIDKVNDLHRTITKDFAMASLHTFGHVLHSAKIEVEEDIIDWNTFKGSKLFVEGNKSIAKWVN
ncbi:hypothetical protein DFP72DRAFT_845660 [Ephemerocybe angulata]|uniref:Uncharacterized protein n=1 Tax=Ephemerocybe angulata TaxID=980116 RepID=A0A8H6I4E2_9AGAR|nr:hypothetical protein DFP72DRAFT_845660 [Tulosesus angulatus]